jgi:type VI secretion system protein ImpJ
MFLEPQHFQQQDRYHDARLRHYAHLFLPFSWGVKTVAIHEPALRNFIFEIEQCEVVTWDGTVLRFHGDSLPSNAKVEPRSFENDLDPGGRPLSVYLGLRRLQLEEGNVQEPAAPEAGERRPPNGGPHRRFVLAETETPDLCAGAGQTSLLHYLVHDVHLLFDVPAARSQDYELVKIAEVLRSPDGKGAVLSKHYVPPCVTIHSSPVLESLIKEIRDLLTAKGRELAEYRRRRGGEMVELGSRDIGYLLMMQTVNRYIPALHHDLEIGDIHPQLVYVRLRQLARELSKVSAAVSGLGERDGADAIPPYRHDQLWPCFDLATRRIKELLTEITTGPVGDVLLPWDGEYFSAGLDESLFAGDNRYYLAIKSDLGPAELFRLLQDTGKITAREDMPKLEKSFLFGLKIESLESPPEELLMRAHYRYFLIDRRSEHWEKIEQRRSIAVYCTDLPPETEMRLIVVFGNK